MIGPSKKKMPDKLVCTDCEVLVVRHLGETPRFPEKRTVYFCAHEELDYQVACIKKFPYTPQWCPALDRNHPIKGGENVALADAH